MDFHGGWPGRDDPVSGIGGNKQPSRRRVMAGVAWATPAIVGIGAAPALAASARANSCVPHGTTSAVAGGRVLSGSVLGIDLDTVTGVDGLCVANNGAGDIAPQGWVTGPTPARQVVGDPTAFVNDIDAAAINDQAVIPAATRLGAGTGLFTQYARAVENGYQLAASGAVTQTGGVQPDLGSDAPTLAEVDLAHLVGTLLPSVTLSPVANLRLQVGALWGRALWNACTGQVARDYLIGRLDTAWTSPALADLAHSATRTVGRLQAGVDQLARGTNPGRIGVPLDALDAALDELQTGLASAAPTVQALSADIDLAAVRAALTQPVTSADGIVGINPGTAGVRIDLGAALGPLNRRDPNTDLVLDAAAVTTITGALTEAVRGTWLTGLKHQVEQAIWLARVSGQVLVPITVQGQVALHVQVGFTDVPVAGLRDGTVTTTGTPSSTITTSSTVLGDGLPPELVDDVVATVAAAVLPAVGSTIADRLTPTWAGMDTPARAVHDEGGQLFSVLQTHDVLSVTVNWQQSTEPGTTTPWVPTHEVAALKLGVLGERGGVQLLLGRARVGPIGAWTR
ncbi:choice-of-anchor G family protein [Propionibacteriaceae bacterium G57]|uniref:choice-of-anchor G family protein n=1 Tax=Aestuariimicrobium sp. G57 TaxID=3418485 RepID=UPI003DA6E209